MRPRHYTAENGAPQPLQEPVEAASMRPRHFTAENGFWPSIDLVIIELQ